MSKETNSITTARCYSLAFRGEPWNEAFKDEADNFYGAEKDLTWKNEALTRAYPLRETADYITKETNRPDSLYVQQYDPNNPRRVVAFGWGYSYANSREIIEDKWQGLEGVMKRRMQNIIQRWTSNQKFWYLSEVGVLPSFQGQGLGTKVVSELLDKVGDMPIILRTNAKSPMTRIAQKSSFMQILGPFTYDGLVVNELVIGGGLDPLNNERVLYVKNPNEDNDIRLTGGLAW